MLYCGEHIGNGTLEPKVDIAVDPLDGTTSIAMVRPLQHVGRSIKCPPDAGRQRSQPVLYWQRRGLFLFLTLGRTCEAGQHQRSVQDSPG